MDRPPPLAPEYADREFLRAAVEGTAASYALGRPAEAADRLRAVLENVWERAWLAGHAAGCRAAVPGPADHHTPPETPRD